MADSDIIKFGETQIGDVANLESANYSEGAVIFRVVADKQEDDAKGFLNYYKGLLNTMGADDVQIVSIPRARGVRIYQNAEKETLTVWGIDYGNVVCKSGRIRSIFGNGYGIFEVEFIGSQ